MSLPDSSFFKRQWSLTDSWTGEDPPAPEEKEFATLTLPDGSKYQFEILNSTVGPKAIDIQNLYAQTGLFTFDPGFTSTCSCLSAITFIDGDKGKLVYRGYEIQDLAKTSTFEETSFLILYGHLPSKAELEHHKFFLTMNASVHQKLLNFYQGFKSDAHPMAIMVGVVGALSAFYHEGLDIYNPVDQARASYRLIAQMPNIAAMAYKTSIGEPIVHPRNDLTYVENFLYMMFAHPRQPYYINPMLVEALEVWMILHMDHEQNASTSTVRIAGSSQANPYACIASGITTLWGPAHGGANEAVLQMLEEIGHKDKIPEFLSKVKEKNSGIRLMGFGHRVYKNYDPRAKVMQELCHSVLEELEIKDNPLMDLAKELERVALSDEYFIKRKLYPNVDFYSGIMLKAMGFPTSMFTVLFAVARTVGWISHWKEMIADPKQKIGRPRQLFVGPRTRTYTKIDDRIQSDEVPMVDAPVYSAKYPPPKGKRVSVHSGSGPITGH
jgi:citrate synthase